MKQFYTLLVIVLVGFVGKAQTIIFPDANFKAKLLSASTTNYIALDIHSHFINIDSNGDGEIQASEASQIAQLNVTAAGITDLTGLSYFTNLTDLTASSNPLVTFDRSVLGDFTVLIGLTIKYGGLTTINVSGMTNLHALDLEGNSLTSLNINGLANLTTLTCVTNQITSLTASAGLHYINCGENQLAYLNVDSCTNLIGLSCYNNLISTLNVNQLTNLTDLDCSNNHLTSLTVNNLSNLVTLHCYLNQITSLDVSNLNSLLNIMCNDNQLTTFDISNAPAVSGVSCGSNPLVSLNLKNGATALTVDFSGAPTLRYICTNAGQLATVNTNIYSYGYTNCHANTYCSFTPGGTYYTILGKNKFDANTNGCDASDYAQPHLKVSFSDGSNTGSVIADDFGEFRYDVQAGTHVLTPVLENPTYFTISPTSATIGFPSSSTPFTQNFCITANGSHPDLEIAVYPTSSARPGFDADYIIFYKNKGNIIQNGSVTFTFDGNRMDYSFAFPLEASQTANTITWNFSNLAVMQSGYIHLRLHINSPTDTPAVNAGNILTFNANVTGVTDETPADNVVVLNQVVVSSFDPNNKTCSEGTTISTAMVGKYLHYVIRFENNGTANAENIVVKDIINTGVFDISSLIPIGSSHPYTTKVTNPDQVEFIFQNINLPFDDANNDGYIAFKIKTKPTLVVGSVIPNSANIYFDYNFPITTNTATTTVTALNTQDFEFGSVFSLSPVPAKNSLTITTKQDVAMSSVSIYNMLGQLVQVNTNPSETIDVSGLKTGSYFIKIISDKGTAGSKFIKE